MADKPGRHRKPSDDDTNEIQEPKTDKIPVIDEPKTGPIVTDDDPTPPHGNPAVSGK